ncbi:uncharacterized protein C1orf105 homolog isoform X2 [Fukomys damarensis]|uniref:uncharacterized protein C1orf105 homolog isoform X2 n=1 Tax=Fukomys damarensis TaxID=885580 RepID=UPI001455AF14|nr:uncharacterized protein C1orf105 homolog isoform X2 [Fukomys damarensis]
MLQTKIPKIINLKKEISFQSVNTRPHCFGPTVAVPKFDKVPWLSEASLTNKPLVLSLPKRFHSSADFLTSSKRYMNSPILFQVPDVSSKAERNQMGPELLRNKWLCSACREVQVVQPRTMTTPDDLKLSFKNFMDHRMTNLHQPKAQAAHKPSHDDILTDSFLPPARCRKGWSLVYPTHGSYLTNS